MVPLVHPARHPWLVPSVMHPDPKLAAGSLGTLLALELVANPQAGRVDQDEVPRAKTDMLQDGLDLRMELHEVAKGVRDAFGSHAWQA